MSSVSEEVFDLYRHLLLIDFLPKFRLLVPAFKVQRVNVFIKDVEALDIAAALGLRGKKDVKLYPVYQKTSKSLQNFASVALRSVEIPLQAPAE